VSAGYSGTPLWKKLGIKPGSRLMLIKEPIRFEGLLAGMPDDVDVRRSLRGNADCVVFFTTSRRELERRLAALRRPMEPDGMLWIAWPKLSSGVATDMTENAIREIALPTGLVDTKVCAIDQTWSGLKLVVRRELR
jgi:hypothetical protein